MGLHFLTEAQEETIIDDFYEYTRRDIVELGALASSIDALVQAAIWFYMDRDEREEHQDREVPLLNIIELLIKPIDRFLNEGATLKQEEGEKNTVEELSKKPEVKNERT